MNFCFCLFGSVFSAKNILISYNCICQVFVPSFPKNLKKVMVSVRSSSNQFIQKAANFVNACSFILLMTVHEDHKFLLGRVCIYRVQYLSFTVKNISLIYFVSFGVHMLYLVNNSVHAKKTYLYKLHHSRSENILA